MYKHAQVSGQPRLGTHCLGRSPAEKALRVLVGNELRPGSRKVKNVLGCMFRSTASRLMEVITPLISALIRLYPEYHPVLECVQQRTHRILRGLELLPCEKRL